MSFVYREFGGFVSATARSDDGLTKLLARWRNDDFGDKEMADFEAEVEKFKATNFRKGMCCASCVNFTLGCDGLGFCGRFKYCVEVCESDICDWYKPEVSGD